ncbi:hypothetical protein P3X46_009815 [Hevea brasiliensis]|uniref:DUF1279 domain-containing protein n=1 Tax=Hevea brasiliensis TaxID=3981 RepID=A0ABQ9MC95_HEVBR|nr:hypothetical protein P3X46_009815 [Hevea brasiliensis]
MAIAVQISPLFSATSLINRKNLNNHYFGSVKPPKSSFKHFKPRAIKEKTGETNIPSPSSSSSPEEIAEKYGLEAGLWKVGISTDETGEKVRAFALAYAAHKAASPRRFPPTVALTPTVASWIGKKVDKEK